MPVTLQENITNKRQRCCMSCLAFKPSLLVFKVYCWCCEEENRYDRYIYCVECWKKYKESQLFSGWIENERKIEHGFYY